MSQIVAPTWVIPESDLPNKSRKYAENQHGFLVPWFSLKRHYIHIDHRVRGELIFGSSCTESRHVGAHSASRNYTWKFSRKLVM